jgi:hypothetical protein
MAVQIDATLPRTFDGGITANQIVEGFVSVRTAGAREIAKRLEEMALAAGRDPSGLMQKAVRAASQPIIKGYRNKVRNVTGNLGKSMATRVRKYDGAAVAITGPRRKPGTQGRRTYVNVHQQINFRMTRAGTFNNQQFERMGKGYYFLMGSKNERTRQAKMGSGYPHDFASYTPGEMFPMTLQPGETYKGVKAQHPMEKTITETNGEVLNILINRMQGFIDAL